jgi:hypothetical protein
MLRHRFLFIALSAAMLSAILPAIAQQPPDPAPARKMVWLGIGFTLEKELPPVQGGAKPGLGLRVNYLPYRSPAEKAGVLVDDIIVGMDGNDFSTEPAKLEGEFRESISRHMPGDEITLRLIRAGEVVDIKVLVEERPAGVGAIKEFSSLDAVEKAFPKVGRPEEQLANTLMGEFNIRDAYEDLRRRLAALSDRGDPFRLSRVAYIQDEPFQLRTVAGRTLDQLAAAVDQRNPRAALQLAAEWLDAAADMPAPPPLKTGLTLEQHLDQLVELFGELKAKREEAFRRLTAEDQKYIEENCDDLLDVFAELIDLQTDRNRDRFRRNLQILELAERVDFVKLFEGAVLLSRAAGDKYLDDLESAVRKAWEAAGKPEGIFIDRESPIGKILVRGTGSTWEREDAAILLDLAGKDFYTNNAGSPRGGTLPSALLIDFAGDDAYEATFNWTQGAARLGYGLVIDRQGNDQYVGREWAQGAALLGAALFLDESGDDIYRADQYAQGAAAWGIAIHMDYEGDDVYEAHLLSQAVGMPEGAGWLLNGKGDDRYYSKGKQPTGYGDAGIFDSWSQGSAVGFRGLQSGGIALLYDGAGSDRYEAGNFSQGGGYYFGIGLLRDGGKEDDVYIGSRYNQGFAAHQAAGYFEETGGDDYYTTRQSVAQGLSWDETITAFIDHEGDDVYEGGSGFSQGASAHNGFCLFLDLGGRNRFDYRTPQASAGPNDYHGGKSFSLFIAAEGRGAAYNSRMTPSSIRLNGDYGIFADLPTSIENAVRTKSWRSLIKEGPTH